jgi:hypothetical protein
LKPNEGISAAVTQYHTGPRRAVLTHSPMRIDELEQEDSDIDWFAVDQHGYIIHFASGGGRLPESVASSEENLLELHRYFLELAEKASAASVQLAPDANRGGNYQGQLRYAQRGLFSFYKASLRDLADPYYLLFARPAQPLTIQEIPAPLARLLSRTQLPASILDKTRVDSTTIA